MGEIPMTTIHHYRQQQKEPDFEQIERMELISRITLSRPLYNANFFSCDQMKGESL